MHQLRGIEKILEIYDSLIQPMISHPDIEGFISMLEIISVQGYGSPKRRDRVI